MNPTTLATMLLTISLLGGKAMAFVPNKHQQMATRRFVKKTTALFATHPTATPARVVSEELLGLFNSQVTRELSASQLYLSASVWCDQRDLIGMASFVSFKSLLLALSRVASTELSKRHRSFGQRSCSHS